MAKHGKLKDMKIHEISLVDLPANKLPFLFFKRKGDQQIDPISKKKKITIEIESDGTVGGTNIAVNGEKLSNLRSFDFSFYGNDPKTTINASYSKESGEGDGFSRTESYYLSKGMIMKKETLKALQTYLGTEDIDFEKKVSEEDIAKALTLITEHYKESFPEDLENAVGVIAKCATNRYEAEGDKDSLKKAGAKFSKDVLKKLKEMIAAVEALKSILPDEKNETQKSDSDSVTGDLAKQIAQLNEVVAKLGSEKKDDDSDSVAKKLAETLEGISGRLKTIEDGGVTKKSISGDDDSDDGIPKGAGKDGKILWKSLQPEKQAK